MDSKVVEHFKVAHEHFGFFLPIIPPPFAKAKLNLGCFVGWVVVIAVAVPFPILS